MTLKKGLAFRECNGAHIIISKVDNYQVKFFRDMDGRGRYYEDFCSIKDFYKALYEGGVTPLFRTQPRPPKGLTINISIDMED